MTNVTNALSTVGLTMDVVGAVTLSFGLFRNPRPLYPGWVNGPNEAARDHAFGIAGGTLLVLGFFGQILPGLGVGNEITHRCAAYLMLVTLPLATLLTVAIYSVALHVAYGYKRRWAEAHTDGFRWHFEFRPRLRPPRLWALVGDETGEEAG